MGSCRQTQPRRRSVMGLNLRLCSSTEPTAPAATAVRVEAGTHRRLRCWHPMSAHQPMPAPKASLRLQPPTMCPSRLTQSRLQSQRLPVRRSRLPRQVGSQSARGAAIGRPRVRLPWPQVSRFRQRSCDGCWGLVAKWDVSPLQTGFNERSSIAAPWPPLQHTNGEQTTSRPSKKCPLRPPPAGLFHSSPQVVRGGFGTPPRGYRTAPTWCSGSWSVRKP